LHGNTQTFSIQRIAVGGRLVGICHMLVREGIRVADSDGCARCGVGFHGNRIAGSQTQTYRRGGGHLHEFLTQHM
jgi:hypothetical protein